MNTQDDSASDNRGNGKSPPVFTRKAWPLQVAVFEFENESGVNHSIELTRVFRRAQAAKWETTTWLNRDDLLPAAKLLTDAYDFVRERAETSYRSGRREQDAGRLEG